MTRLSVWLLLMGLTHTLAAAPVVVINTLDVRPVFTVQRGAVVETRTVAPGQRITLEEGVFSGLGEKAIALQGGQTYYLARLGATPRLYWLAPDQCLVINQAGRAVDLGWGAPPRRWLAVGTVALASVTSGPLVARWTDGDREQTQTLAGGLVYRLVLDSPGLGTTVALTPWGATTE